MKLAIFSKTFNQAREYARENKLYSHEWFFIDNVDKLIGVIFDGKNFDVVRVGDYFKRSDLLEVEQEIRMKTRIGII